MGKLGLGYGLKMGQLGSKLNALIRAYISRVTGDSGTVDNSLIVRKAYAKLPAQDSIVFAWMGGAGSKKRTSTIYKFFTKLYSLFGTNDATQTTENSQPYVSGNIAPNEVECLKNPNGDSRYVTHPEISFLATDEWSVTTVIQWNSDVELYRVLFGSSGQEGSVRIANIGNRLSFAPIGSGGVQVNFASNSNLPLIGKQKSLTFIAEGNGTLKLYIDGSFFESITANTSIVFTSFMQGYLSNRGYVGSYFTHIIRSAALTAAQVSAEHTLLRSIYPEIPSVVIGEQEWATSNLEQIATPQGNVIANVTEEANVEKITATADRDFSSDTGWWVKTGETTINAGGSGVCNILSTDGGTTNIRKNGLTTLGKWYKFTFDITRNNGGILAIGSLGSIDYVITDMSIGSKLLYFKSVQSDFVLRRYSGTSDFDIDNLSLLEVGWSGLGDLYDWLIDEGYTEADASKEAAAWCYYNNDSEIGSVYGKLYNWYAAKLLQNDIDAYNTANPTAHWGWRVPTETDFNTLATALGGASVAGGKMKVAGEDYWNSPNTGADNSSGFSALPSGIRIDGSFGGLSEFCYIGTLGLGFRIAYNSVSINGALYSSAPTRGMSLRLIKD